MKSEKEKIFAREDFSTLSKEVIKSLQEISSKKMHLDIDTLSDILISNGVVANLFDGKAKEADKNKTELKYWKGLYLEHKNKCVECENENATKDILLRKLILVFDCALHSHDDPEVMKELKGISNTLLKCPDRETINRCITKLNALVNKFKIKDAASSAQSLQKKKSTENTHQTVLEASTEVKKDIFIRMVNKLSVILPNVGKDVKEVKEQISKEYIMDDPSRFMDDTAKIIEKQISFYEQGQEKLKAILMMLLSELNETEKNVIFAFKTYEGKTVSDKSFYDELMGKVNDIHRSFELNEYIEEIRDIVKKKVIEISQKIKDKEEKDLTQTKTINTELKALRERIKRAYEEIVMYQERMKKQSESSFTDLLTGVLNKKAIDLRLRDEYERFKTGGNSCSVMVCDLDKLNDINERFGYSTGDSVLAKVAYILRKNIRECDYVGRCGGEEFLVVMPDIDIESAGAIAEKLRKVVDDAKFYFKDEKVNVAMSIGVTQFINKDNYTTVFERADKALYMAKSLGRNKVVSKNGNISGTV